MFPFIVTSSVEGLSKDISPIMGMTCCTVLCVVPFIHRLVININNIFNLAKQVVALYVYCFTVVLKQFQT